MLSEIEITTLDLRYEDRRMKNRVQEGRLLASIAERGIDEPLEGVDRAEARVLLNGFKRYRCARKLGMGMVPYTSLGEDVATGIVALLRLSNTRSLGILEQAGFIDELRNTQKLSVAQIAERLSRSKSWVSMRVGLIGEMSEGVRRALFSGAFPVYPYMYTLRQFMRMNAGGKEEVEQFVAALSGKGLSVRDIEHLAHGYFRGPESLREEIRAGNVALPLKQLRQDGRAGHGCNPFECGLIRDLELTGKYMQRVMGKSQDPRLKTRAFHAQASLLAEGVLGRSKAFFQTLRTLHDRSRQT